MILTLLQYMIFEKCIDILFKNIKVNFNTISPIIINSTSDFYIGQRFTSIYVIGNDIRLTNAVVTYVHPSTVYKYVMVIDDSYNRYAINSYDISNMRFYQ